MESLPTPGNGHKSFSTHLPQSPKERHKLSLIELAFGRNLGTAASRAKRLERQIQELCVKMDKALDDLLALLQTGDAGENLSWTSWVQERITAKGISILLSKSSLKNQDQDQVRPTLGGSSSRVRTRVPRTPPPKQEQDMAPGFLRFWSCYQRRVAKQEAYRAWTDLRPSTELEDRICEAAKRQFETNFRDTEPSKVPHPATWLRAARWEDEICERAASADDFERIRREKDEAIREYRQRAQMGRQEVPRQQGV